ncbi:MAG: glycine cleavage system protein GcvH [Clostridia bacterium]|nr:glycine cleavage system protein GcvH [Deltaproteobacteria bacterium]
MSLPQDLKYTKDHEWVRLAGDVATVGITQHAQEQLGDVVFVELPKIGTKVAPGASFGTVESVKAVSDLYAPLAGEVTEVNDALTKAPETVNSDPYGAAWMVKIKLASAGDAASLLAPSDYQSLIG